MCVKQASKLVLKGGECKEVACVSVVRSHKTGRMLQGRHVVCVRLCGEDSISHVSASLSPVPAFLTDNSPSAPQTTLYNWDISGSHRCVFLQFQQLANANLLFITARMLIPPSKSKCTYKTPSRPLITHRLAQFVHLTCKSTTSRGEHFIEPSLTTPRQIFL